MSKPIRVAISGYGRIGRLFLRCAAKSKNIQLVAINDPFMDLKYIEYQTKYDSVHRRFDGTISTKDGKLIVNKQPVTILTEKSPKKLPWKSMGIDWLVESSGVFTTLKTAGEHITAGAKNVLISAPSADAPMLVMGVNHLSYKPSMKVISMASCTTNCLAPIAKILNAKWGMAEGLMTTVHSLTNSQPTVDGISRKDWRGGRSAVCNIIPSSTGAAKAVTQVIPELKNKLTGMAFRVGTPDVSVVDLTCRLAKPAKKSEIDKAMKIASETYMKGILGYADEDVVSSDFIGSTFSSVYDSKAGISLSNTFHKIVAWYDNEWGYSQRLVDSIVHYNGKQK